MTTLNTIIEEEKEWTCIGHTEYGDKISLDGHSYIEVPTDYIKQVRREERAKIRNEVEKLKKDNVFVPDHDPSPYGGLICRECKAQEDCNCHVFNEALDTVLAKLTESDNTPDA